MASRKLSVSECLDAYLTEHARLKCNAADRQEYAAANLNRMFARTSVSSVDVPASRKYVAARVSGTCGRPATRATVRRELNVLVAAANHAVKWRRLAASELPTVELPEAEQKDAEVQWLTKPELKMLMGAADGHLLRFIRLAYYTGGRRASIERLQKDQLDFDGKRINLRKPNERRTVKRRPIVPLYDHIVPDLKWLIERAQGPRLFGGRTFYKGYRELCEDVGLSNKRNPHILRHSRATHLLQDKVSLYDVARLLGDTPSTIERVYGHHSPEYLAQTTGDVF